jgi:hypothetical protein
MAPQSREGSKTQENKPLNTTKAGSKTPKNLFICCFLVIRVQKWFVKLQMAFL